MSWIDYEKSIKNWAQSERMEPLTMNAGLKEWLQDEYIKARDAFRDAPDDSMEEEYQFSRYETLLEVLEKLSELSDLTDQIDIWEQEEP